MVLRACAIQSLLMPPDKAKGEYGTDVAYLRCCGCNNLFRDDFVVGRNEALECAKACAKMINEGKKYSKVSA